MKSERIYIQKIPAIIWGSASEKAYLYIHGQGGSKEEAELFAKIAESHSWQVLSVDLPEHGERACEKDCFDPWHAVPELLTVLEYAKSHWSQLSLFANSIGAWFSMLAFENLAFKQAQFVSPILDMPHLISNMMNWAGVSEERLKREQTIPTSFGQTLSWEYLEYARNHVIIKWETPTRILYGEKDNLTEQYITEDFAKRFNCELTIMENGEHWFHTPQQLDVLSGWAKDGFK